VALLSALLGAVVGDVATLVGSVLVNRWELRRAARFRMYQELLPLVKNETWPRYRWRGNEREEFERSLDALVRAGTVAGPLEWRIAAWLLIHGTDYARKYASAVKAGDETPALKEEFQKEAYRFDDELRRLDETLREHVRRLWPRLWPRAPAATPPQKT
jgi:hypothetical protein